MPPPPLTGVDPSAVQGVFWFFGMPPLISGSYTCSHGATPGTIIIRTQPGAKVPDASPKDVFITDRGVGFVVRNCKVERWTIERSDAGDVTWNFELSDGRWRFRDLALVDGWYNQMDPNSKYIPATVRSPTELAVLLLEAAGISRYLVDLPPGLTSEGVAAIPEFLPTGVNFVQAGLNPPVNWYADNPILALSRLAEECGRRLVYDPVTETMRIVPPGVGPPLPAGSIHTQMAAVANSDTPDGIEVRGDPTKWEALFQLYAVGLEYDKTLRPINFLSYTPTVPAKAWVVTVTVTSVKDFDTFQLYCVSPNPGEEGLVNTSVTAGGGSTTTSIAAALAAGLTSTGAQFAWFKDKFKAVASGSVVTITGPKDGSPIDVATGRFDKLAGNPSLTIKVSPGAPAERSWRFSPPPLFPGIQATPQLTLEQARALAQRSVFKMYRLTGCDVTTGKPPIQIPGYGAVYRRQNIVLLDSMCTQVVPDAGDVTRIDRNGDPLIKNVYDGYSRDRRAEVYGSVVQRSVSGFHYIGDGNIGVDMQANGNAALHGIHTKPDDLVFCEFSVDPVWQAICFSDFQYKYGAGLTILEPDLVLRTACHVRDPDTNQLVGYADRAVFNPNGSAIKVLKRPDVQLNVIGSYTFGLNSWRGNRGWKLSGTQILEADAVVRARYYLTGAIAELKIKPGGVVQFNGIIAVPLSGLVQQVTWDTQGGSGCRTVVSLNCEHATWIPPFPARRRAENLAPVARAVPPNARGRIGGGGDFGSGGSGELK